MDEELYLKRGAYKDGQYTYAIACSYCDTELTSFGFRNTKVIKDCPHRCEACLHLSLTLKDNDFGHMLKIIKAQVDFAIKNNNSDFKRIF